MRIGYGKTQEWFWKWLPRKGWTLRTTSLMVGSGGKKKEKKEEVKARNALERAKKPPQNKSKRKQTTCPFALKKRKDAVPDSEAENSMSWWHRLQWMLCLPCSLCLGCWAWQWLSVALVPMWTMAPWGLCVWSCWLRSRWLCPMCTEKWKHLCSIILVH